MIVFACGGDGDQGTNDPTDVAFGETAVVVVLNPVVNDANDESVPSPGSVVSGVTLTTDDELTATTDAAGVAVLGPLSTGTRTITLSGEGLSGSFNVTLRSGELRELAVAADGASATIMVEVDYKTEQLHEITPDMTDQQVNDALAVSDTVVFIRGGNYVGDLELSGSRVTLFGEGLLGGDVIIEGNVTISGSDSRIRGTSITGNLSVPASGVGITFSSVSGDADASGSDSMFLHNSLCGTTTLDGSGAIALGNAGAAPISTCP